MRTYEPYSYLRFLILFSSKCLQALVIVKQKKRACHAMIQVSIPTKLIVCQIMRPLFLFMLLFIFCCRISHMIVETGRNILWWQDVPGRFAKIFFRKDYLRWNALSVTRNLCIVRNTILEMRNKTTHDGNILREKKYNALWKLRKSLRHL